MQIIANGTRFDLCFAVLTHPNMSTGWQFNNYLGAEAPQWCDRLPSEYNGGGEIIADNLQAEMLV